MVDIYTVVPGIFANPVVGSIYLTPSASLRWFRSQAFGCTGFEAERELGDCEHFHRGIDIARGPDGCGDNLLAPAAGTVVGSGTMADGNMFVVLRHPGGWASGSAHLQSPAIVVAGQRVAKGQKIGYVGRSGRATGCHDHFAIKSSFPTSGVSALSFWGDVNGKWEEPWRRLQQNVTAFLEGSGCNVRTAPKTGAATLYAVSRADGTIRRVSDNADLGPTNAPRKWGGQVVGGAWSMPDGQSGSTWERLWIDHAYRYLATGVITRSV